MGRQKHKLDNAGRMSRDLNGVRLTGYHQTGQMSGLLATKSDVK